MVTLQPIGEQKAHFLKSKIHFNGFTEGSLKKCAIQKMSDGRMAVFGYHFNNHFYKVFDDENDVQDAFDEISYEAYALANAEWLRNG